MCMKCGMKKTNEQHIGVGKASWGTVNDASSLHVIRYPAMGFFPELVLSGSNVEQVVGVDAETPMASIIVRAHFEIRCLH